VFIINHYGFEIHSFKEKNEILCHHVSGPPLIPPRRETSPLWGDRRGDYPEKIIATKVTAIKPDCRQASLQGF